MTHPLPPQKSDEVFTPRSGLIDKLQRLVLRVARESQDFRSNRRASLESLEAGLASRRSPDSPLKRTVVERVARAYALAKQAQAAMPKTYQAGGEWTSLTRMMKSGTLSAESITASGLAAELDAFHRNSLSAGISTHEFYKDAAAAGKARRKSLINAVWRDVDVWRNLTERSTLEALAMPEIGEPWGLLVDGTLVTTNAARLNYYAHHLNRLIADRPSSIVAEIGGGFGGLAYFLQKENPAAKYVDFDLPETLLIGSYYLCLAFPERKILLYGEAPDQPLSRQLLTGYDIVLLPNFCLLDLADKAVDVMVNTMSLSEMDAATVEEYIGHVVRVASRYFYHVNSDRALRTGDAQARHVEVPASKFPIPPAVFKRLYKTKSLFGGGGDRYREYLYERVAS